MEKQLRNTIEELTWERLDRRLRQLNEKGEGVEELHDREFEFYRCWCHHLGLTPRFSEEAQCKQKDLKEWYWVYASMSNLKGLANLRCFLYHRWPDSDDPSAWLQRQIWELYEVLRISSNRKKEKKGPLDQYFNYDDLNALFSSRLFVDHWGQDCESPLHRALWDELSHPKRSIQWKTYLEKSDCHLFGVLSWLHFYRNWYFLIFTHIIFITGVFLATGRHWEIKLILGGSILAFSLLLKGLTECWLDPLSWRHRWGQIKHVLVCGHSRALSVTPDTSIPEKPFPADQYKSQVLRPEQFRSHLPRGGRHPRYWIQWIWSFIFTVLVGLVKFASEWLLVFLAEDLSVDLLEFPVIHVILLWLFLHLGFLLDTVFFYNLLMSISGYVLGRCRGVGRVIYWRQVAHLWPRLPDLFVRKFVCSPAKADTLSLAQKRALWALFWNRMLWIAREDDLLSHQEFLSLCCGLPSSLRRACSSDNWEKGISLEAWFTSHLSPDFQSLPPEAFSDPPDWKVHLRNEQLHERVLHLINSLLMNHLPPACEDLHLMPSCSVVIPVYNESVIYSLEEICRPVNAGRSVIGFMISKFSDEWDNFLERHCVMNSPRLQRVTFYLTTGHMVFDPDCGEVNDYLFQLRLWVSYRFQSLARTVRGIQRRRDALHFLHLIHLHLFSSSSSSDGLQWDQPPAWLDDKFQVLVAYQTYGSLKLDDAADLQKRTDLHFLLHRYPNLRLSYLDTRDNVTWNCLISADFVNHHESSNPSDQVITLHSLRLPGYPILGEGKPENQHQALAFVSGEYLQALDMNQDAFFEEEFKFPVLIGEFRRDPHLRILGFPELVTTRDFNLLGYLHAFSERTFTTAVQRLMDLLGLRMHYGHPDLFETRWVECEGGFSRQSYVSEDIFAGYEVCLRGFGSRHVEYFQEGKAKEVGLLTSTKFFTKVSAGAAQQMFTRYVHWITTSPHTGYFRAFNHFFISIGFFVEHQLLKYLLLLFLFSRMVFPNEEVAAKMYEDGPFSTANIIFGAWVLQLGFLLMFVGLSEMILERGVWYGVGRYLAYFPITLIYYFFHVLTNAAGYADGMANRARYIPTGRGFMLEHMSFRHLYTTFKASHLYFAFLCLVLLIFLAATNYPTLSVVWAIVVGTLIWILLPFLTNPGGSLLQCRFSLWWQLHRQDWRDWLAFAWRSSLFYRHNLWPIGLFGVIFLVVVIHFHQYRLWIVLLGGFMLGLALPWALILYLVVGVLCLSFLFAFNLLIAIPCELTKILFRRWWIQRYSWLYLDFFDKDTIGPDQLSKWALSPSLELSPSSSHHQYENTTSSSSSSSSSNSPTTLSPSIAVEMMPRTPAPLEVDDDLEDQMAQLDQRFFLPAGQLAVVAASASSSQVRKVYPVEGQSGRRYLVAEMGRLGLNASHKYLGALHTPTRHPSSAASSTASLSGVPPPPHIQVTPLSMENVLDLPMPEENTAQWDRASTLLVPPSRISQIPSTHHQRRRFSTRVEDDEFLRRGITPSSSRHHFRPLSRSISENPHLNFRPS